MKIEVGPCSLELVRGDITDETVDAIANAANSALAGGGGVDGAIHRAGGPSIMKELTERYDGCPTGSAVITGGGDLKAQHVIHAVGPRYRGREEDVALLASAYRSSLELAVDHGAASLSFPSISTGIYGYPVDAAARVALSTVIAFLEDRAAPVRVRFVLFSNGDLAAYRAVLRDLRGG